MLYEVGQGMKKERKEKEEEGEEGGERGQTDVRKERGVRNNGEGEGWSDSAVSLIMLSPTWLYYFFVSIFIRN